MDSRSPWRDPRSVYAALGGPLAGGARPDGASNAGLLKRTLSELDHWQQTHRLHAVQHALFLRSVKQRTAQIAAISAPPPPLVDLGEPSLSSGLSSYSPASAMPVPATATASGQTLLMRNQLQELERQLLDDDDTDGANAATSASDLSGVTGSEWGEAMRQLNTSVVPSAAGPVSNPVVSKSPSNSSSSSTVSSSASCSPAACSSPSRQLLVETAIAIADGNAEASVAALTALKRAANPNGDAEQRLLSMMTAALAARIAPVPPSGALSLGDICGAEQREATQLLHELSPCFRLARHAANLVILNAVCDSRNIHIIDFDVLGGAQHAALIQSLGERHAAESIKITAVSDPSSPFTAMASRALGAVGERLKKIADRFGIALRFNVASLRPSELESAALGCEPGEAVAVNLAFVLSRVPDESVSPANPRDEVLRRVRALTPRVVALAEQEVNTNTAPFAARFAECCAHYAAQLEALDAAAASAGRERADERGRAEAALGRKAANAVSREGAERLERCELYGKWRARMGMAGLWQVAVGSGAAEGVRARMQGTGRGCPAGLTVKEEGGGLGVGWMGRTLTMVSSWR